MLPLWKKGTGLSSSYIGIWLFGANLEICLSPSVWQRQKSQFESSICA